MLPPLCGCGSGEKRQEHTSQEIGILEHSSERAARVSHFLSKSFSFDGWKDPLLWRYTTFTANIATKMRTYPTCETWAMIIALFFVFWPVCWFPLVMDSCKTTDHYCTNCNEHVGRVKPLSDCCVKEMG
mmetsp:Transcript_14693/g.30143  ORF Transcript_14693/g.30143 Transcript_14693/m.30143 type:complete len:129 (+) Transcript_14693:585-971(+)